MQIDPLKKIISFRMGELEGIQSSLNEIERIVLASEETKGQEARAICSELNQIRDQLNFPRGIQHHDKFME